MAAKSEIRIAENISNQAENRWEKPAQNKLAEDIGNATKEKLGELEGKLPVRIVKAGDTLSAIALGMKKAGVLEKFSWNMEVTYHLENQTYTTSLAQAGKLFPGNEVSFDGEKLVVKLQDEKQKEKIGGEWSALVAAEDPASVAPAAPSAAPTEGNEAKLKCDALEKILANPQATRIQILEALDAAVLASALNKNQRNPDAEKLFIRAREQLVAIPADFKDATKSEKDIIRQLIGLGFTVEKKHSGEAEKVMLSRDGDILEIASTLDGVEVGLKKLQAKASKVSAEKQLPKPIFSEKLDGDDGAIGVRGKVAPRPRSNEAVGELAEESIDANQKLALGKLRDIGDESKKMVDLSNAFEANPEQLEVKGKLEKQCKNLLQLCDDLVIFARDTKLPKIPKRHVDALMVSYQGAISNLKKLGGNKQQLDSQLEKFKQSLS